ncbi:serine/threonine-protein kinase [Psychrobacter sp. AOP22-C1-22]|uniref:serine/threonine-protein kinase n=1 Tax=unclassified Psychrobacter TaxID=196806 RepID=UPI001787A36A|nr:MULTISPECIES: serine/threonine-protein kinase [unclassified Psychrobacter]MBE0406257.1 serine/threonine protein kinase [Psychrobacter sp. FME6]MBE0444636.1 serine/threonine protein kinase [Psychrobacter sp. FME5]MDN5801103.1 serine/threonine protein kinase [Psychrobacter sp.]
MKNSASNLSNIQALQAHAQQLLPIITQALSARYYTELAHQRLSQQNSGKNREQNQNAKSYDIKNNNYQGLTRAQHPQFGNVMIKWQLSALSNVSKGGASQDSDKLADLTDEADVLKSINTSSNHQNNLIAPLLLDYENITLQILEPSLQLIILVMPYYLNGSLASQLSAQKHLLLTAQQKHQFILQAAYLIRRLHKIGWLHNDIKPSNILLKRTLTDGTNYNRITSDLLLTDFALAQRFDSASNSNPAGTPAYLAPERWQGQGATVSSDIYAFGIMLYEILVGKRPFRVRAQSSQPMLDWAIQHCQQPVPKLPSEYDRYQHIIDKALAKWLETRYRSMEEVLRDLTLLQSR